jgi:hypothetical protein
MLKKVYCQISPFFIVSDVFEKTSSKHLYIREPYSYTTLPVTNVVVVDSSFPGKPVGREYGEEGVVQPPG